MNFSTDQRHEYRRHGYGLLVTWYTWFIALNYGVLGWLAANATIQHQIVCAIATLFTTHGIVGLGVMYFIYKHYIAEFNDAVDIAERRLAKMYVVGIYGMAITYAIMVVTWIVVPFFWRGVTVAG